MAEVRAGLFDTDPEVVLRCVFLDKPALLRNLTIADGHKFVHLWKGCPILNKFLTGKSVSQRPLANSLVNENLATKRNEACRLALAEEPEKDEEAADPTDALGLEEDEVAESKDSRKLKNRRFCL